MNVRQVRPVPTGMPTLGKPRCGGALAACQLLLIPLLIPAGEARAQDVPPEVAEDVQGEKPAPATTKARVAPSPPKQPLRMLTRLTRGRYSRPVEDGDSLRSCETLHFELSANRRTFAYLIHVFPGGGAAVHVDGLPVDSGQPLSRTLRFDHETGRERFLLVMSQSPLAEADPALHGVLEAIKKTGRWPASLPFGVRPRMRARPRGVQRARGDTRGDRRRRVVETAADARGVAARFVSIEHRSAAPGVPRDHCPAP